MKSRVSLDAQIRPIHVLILASLCVPIWAGCGDDEAPGESFPDSGAQTVDAGTADAAPAPAVGITFVDIERAVDVTPDGRLALLWTQSTGDLHFFNTVTQQLVTKTSLDVTQLQNQQPHAISQTRRIAATYGAPGQAGLWSEEGWYVLGTPLASGGCYDTSGPTPVLSEVAAAFDVSPDGNTSVGFLWDGCGDGIAFRWTDEGDAGSFQQLQKLGPDGAFNRASAVSADGKIAGGFASIQGPEFFIDRAPVIWNQDGSGFYLEPENFNEPGEVKTLSADGSIAAGDFAGPVGGQLGFVWSQATGVQRFDSGSATPEAEKIFVNDMTGNGQAVLGGHETRIDPTDFFSPVILTAFAWSSAGGLKSLVDIAAASGVVIPAGTTLTNVAAVSADGTVIIGDAQIAGATPEDFPTLRLYVLVLPAGALDQ